MTPGRGRYDVLVVGGGPAGLSAALLLGRCRRRVLVVDDGQPRNAPSRALHGYLTRDGIPPSEFLRLGRSELRRYPDVEFRRGRVEAIERVAEGFRARLAGGGGAVAARFAILATGMRDELPGHPGFREFYGRGVFHCPYCDAWEVRDRPLAAYAPGARGDGLARKLLSWSADVTWLSDGYRPRSAPPGVKVEANPLANLEGGPEGLRRIVFRDGRSIPCRAVFFQGPPVQRSALAESLGCAFTPKGAVRAGPREEASCPGLYVVGDASHDVQFVIVAAAEGARAAHAIHERLVAEERRSV